MVPVILTPDEERGLSPARAQFTIELHQGLAICRVLSERRVSHENVLGGKRDNLMQDRMIRMTDSVSELERQLNELKGVIDLLFELREEAARWVEEAEDGSKREAFENVLGHIEALESEYRNRQEQLQKKAKSA
jgi:hypothetical protein